MYTTMNGKGSFHRKSASNRNRSNGTRPTLSSSIVLQLLGLVVILAHYQYMLLAFAPSQHSLPQWMRLQNPITFRRNNAPHNGHTIESGDRFGTFPFISHGNTLNHRLGNARKDTVLWLGIGSSQKISGRHSTVVRSTAEKLGETPARKEDDGRSDGIVDRVSGYFTGDDAFDQRKRGNLQLVAGSGKTYIAWKVMERLLRHAEHKHGGQGPSIGLYVTPYLNLVDQALNNREDHGIMTGDTEDACETMIIASRSSRKRETCTTDVEVIVDFLTDGVEPGQPTRTNSGAVVSKKILVCTYNSLPRLGAAIERLNDEQTGQAAAAAAARKVVVDFAVFDEAHRMEGLISSTSSGGFAYGLYDSNIGIRNRLFMTGTPHNYTQTANVLKCLPTRPDSVGNRLLVPRRENSDGGGDDDDDDGLSVSDTVSEEPRIRSFSDENLFGPCLAHKTHRESVQDNITLPISLYFVDTEVFHEHDTDERRSIYGANEKDYFLPMGIKSAFTKLNVKHAVSFHSTNQRARDFLTRAEGILGSKDNGGPIELFNMDHTNSPSERSEILRAAQNSSRSLITNCKLLSMGVDNAAWDLVIIADPVRSTVDGRQMIGRVGRKAPGKERGYVLVPLPTEGDLSTNSSPAYQIFVNTFQHMLSVNPEMRQDVLFVIEKSQELGRSLMQTEYPDRIVESFVFPSTISIGRQFQLIDHAIVEFGNREGYYTRWNTMFNLLVVYKEREGDCNVPSKHEEEGKNLGTWLQTQRQNKKKGILDVSLEERLTNVGVVWDNLGQKWEDMFTLLQQYKEREGDCSVPSRHQEEGKNLGPWLDRQRKDKKKGTLDVSLEERLTNVGVVWDQLGQKWEDMFMLLQQYKEREGDCNVPGKHQEEGKNLGPWLDMQRTNKRKGTLDVSLEERLTSVGVVWSQYLKQWEGMFMLLQQYKEREGDCYVPFDHQEEGKNLGTWLDKQRKNKKKGILDVSLEERLTSYGVVWDVWGQKWEDMFMLLQQYKEREGDCKVPFDHQEEGKNLGTWLQTQRQNKKKGILDVSLEERLTNVGVVWDNLGQKWEDMFTLLQQYKEREGDCNVPQRHQEDGKTLGLWLAYQREKVKKGTLNENAKARLADIGVVWDVDAQQWEDMFLLLQRYKEREGDCNVPQRHQEEGKNLGNWLKKQHEKKKKGTLDVSLEERLTSVGVVWGMLAQ